MIGLFRRRTLDRERDHPGRVAAILEERGIAAVVDVGANRGGYASSLRRAGFRGPILSFEPGAVAHAALSAAATGDPQWRVATRMALGERQGSAVLHGFNREDMNSILPPVAAAATAFPKLSEAGTEEVPLHRLDAVLDQEWPGLPAPLLLKADTQGSELPVLRGAAGVLDRVAALQLEVPLTRIYGGQPSFAEVVAAVDALGFEPVLASEGFFSKRLRRQIDLDLLFLRR